MSHSYNIVFAGTPDFAAQHLKALIASSHKVIAVYTQPDRPAGRGKKRQASPVKQLATQNQLPFYQPESLKDPSTQRELRALNADLLVVVAYGQILPEEVLSIPKLGCLNVHGSLLPRWRGAAPIQRAIWAGDTETGVTIMQMDKGLDTGAMLLKRKLPIEPEDTSASLYEKLAKVGPALLVDTLEKLQDIQPETQDETEVNYAKKLSKEEAFIDWSIDANQLHRNIRAFNPWPICFFLLNEQSVKVWQASVVHGQWSAANGEIISADNSGILVATGDNAIRLEILQFPGKKPQYVRDVLNAKKAIFSPGKRLQ